MKEDNAFTVGRRKEKFRFGERKKGRVEDITSLADFPKGNE